MDQMTQDAVTLTSALVERRSITPADDGALDIVQNALAPMSFTATRLKFGQIDNLLSTLDGGAGPHLCFCGHTDVVPPGDESRWTSPPFTAAIRDGKIYGRGTADMKGNIAAFIAALSHYITENGRPAGTISLLITGDEEAEAVDGTTKVLRWMKEHNRLADDYLVGEPSNPNVMGEEIKIGRRGSLSGRLIVNGIQGHVAYPDRAANPVPKIISLLHALAAHKFDDGTAHFQPTNLEITGIDTGNMADNVIPGSISAQFNVRFNDLWDAQSLESAIRTILDGYGYDYTLHCRSNAQSFVTKAGRLTDMIQQAVKDITGRTPALATGGGTSDARFCALYGPVVECGLINRTIHQTDEHIALDDLATLTQIYHRFLTLYFAPQG